MAPALIRLGLSTAGPEQGEDKQAWAAAWLHTAESGGVGVRVFALACPWAGPERRFRRYWY